MIVADLQISRVSATMSMPVWCDGYVKGRVAHVAESSVSRWGTSLVVSIPDAIAQQWGVQEGSAIEIIPQGEQIMLCKKAYDLDDMLAQVTSENLHTEWNTGAPQGREAW